MAKQPAEFTQHCFAQSGNCYKPALLLELAGADGMPRFVDYFARIQAEPRWVHPDQLMPGHPLPKTTE